jgi:hypothetical protein
MNSTRFRRFGAIVGAAAVVTTIATAAPSTAKADQGNQDRPCFMIRSHWNNAEGPQPTCPNGRFKTAAADDAGATRAVPSARITDFMS